jgi:outer membrane receptor protein involved in Fe transport
VYALTSLRIAIVVVGCCLGRDAAAEEALSDEDLRLLAEAEAIEIFDERADKPFDRDTTVRLTGEELAERGAVDLKTALALLPDVTVREAGRGGFQIDIRGARKGEVSVLIDGVIISDPYYGNFDVSTIPITDIVQIRVSTTPQSPIDGPGGPGGVIEVHTRDAIGPQVVVARLATDTLPTFGTTGTARVALGKRVGLRLSGGGLAGSRDLPLPMDASIDESRRAATGAARIEYRDGDRRIVVDGFLDDRRYVSPPSDEEAGPVLLIDRQTTATTSARVDVKQGKLQLQAQGWAEYLRRWSRNFTDAGLSTEQNVEKLTATRTGGRFLITRPFRRDARWAASATLVREDARVDNRPNGLSSGDVTVIELAGDLQYERKRFRVDGAAGVALPFGVGADPWLEAKLVGKWKPRNDLELTLTGGRKGRVPSLRERFDISIGNPELRPDIVDHLELRAVEDIEKRLRAEIAPFFRHSTGTIRTAPGSTRLQNTGTLDIYGVDMIGRVQLSKLVAVGAAYQFVRARSQQSNEPLDFLPAHRAEGSVHVTPSARFAGVMRVKYISDALDRGSTVPGYALVEGSFSAQLSREYLALLRIDDLLDRRPETRSGYHSQGRVVSVIFQATWE